MATLANICGRIEHDPRRKVAWWAIPNTGYFDYPTNADLADWDDPTEREHILQGIRAIMARSFIWDVVYSQTMKGTCIIDTRRNSNHKAIPVVRMEDL